MFRRCRIRESARECTGRGRNGPSPSPRFFRLSALFVAAVRSCRRRCAVRRCSNRRIAIRNHASNRRWNRRTSRRRETGAAIARPRAEPEYVGQIAVQCDLCLVLHVRDEFLRDRFVREFHASWFIAVERRGERRGEPFSKHTSVSTLPSCSTVNLAFRTLYQSCGYCISVRPHSLSPERPKPLGRLVMYCANVLFGCVTIDELLGRTR